MPKKKKAGAKKAEPVAPAPEPAAPEEDPETEEISAKDAKSLDAATDYLDAVNNPQETKADSKTMNEAMKRTAAISAAVDAEAAAAAAARERELAKVVVADEDVTFFVENCMVEKSVADRKLRESGGVLIDAINAFVNS